MTTHADKIAKITIFLNNARAPLSGFGRPAFFYAGNTLGVRSKIYGSADDMLADGFASSDQIVIDVKAALSQTPCVEDVMVVQRDDAVAQVDTVTVVTETDGHVYVLSIGASNFSYTAIGGDDTNDVAVALAALVNAGSEPVTAGVPSLGAFTLTADVAGEPFVTSIHADVKMTLVHTTASVGIVEDIAAADAYNPVWYGAFDSDRNDLVGYLLGKTIDSMPRLAFVQSSDSDLIATPYDPNVVADAQPDVASRLKKAGVKRAAVMYTSSSTNPTMPAWIGQCLCQEPGSTSWNMHPLDGVEAELDTLITGDPYNNLLSKSCNVFFNVAGNDVTFQGTTVSGEYIDVYHGLDHLQSLAQNAQVKALVKRTGKNDMTQSGLETMAAQIRMVMLQKSTRGSRSNLIAESRVLPDGTVQTPAFTVTAPRIQDISPANRGGRDVSHNPVIAEATIAGAIHFVAVEITLSV